MVGGGGVMVGVLWWGCYGGGGLWWECVMVGVGYGGRGLWWGVMVGGGCYGGGGLWWGWVMVGVGYGGGVMVGDVGHGLNVSVMYLRVEESAVSTEYDQSAWTVCVMYDYVGLGRQDDAGRYCAISRGPGEVSADYFSTFREKNFAVTRVREG